MNYELAKKLEEAGFPQNPFGPFILPDNSILSVASNDPQGAITGVSYTDGVYVPTLSELIAACGKNLNDLARMPDGTWGVHSTRKAGEEELFYGPTPEEAVAYLWLSLNPKKQENMRETKFRAWDPEKKEMAYFPLGLAEIIGYFSNKEQFARLHRLVWMEYTELTDHNGKEIWEGDVVRGYGVDALVRYVGVGFSPFTMSVAKYERFRASNCEVIGSIYENPELLDPKK